MVTEPHAELNAGLIVIFRSSHPPIFNWNAWSLRLRSSSGTVTDGVFKDEASTLAYAFWDRIGEFLQRSLTDNELSSEEKAQWVQSGLAISPLMGTCLQYSLDFCLAWALIGEWTSRVLFPVPKGPWPRWTCGCPPSKIPKPFTTDSGVGPSCLRTRCPPIAAVVTWYCPCF